MDIQALWPILLAISTPIAGVIGFAIQLRSTRKLRLENEKLQLEIVEMRQRARKAEQLIIEPTNEEVEKYAQTIQFMRVSENEKAQDSYCSPKRFEFPDLSDILILFAAVFFIGYFLYDIFRLFMWLWSLF